MRKGNKNRKEKDASEQKHVPNTKSKGAQSRTNKTKSRGQPEIFILLWGVSMTNDMAEY